MFFKLLLAFTIIPIMELAILIKLGTVFGTLHTVLFVIATAVVGAWLVRIEGFNVMLRYQASLREGIFPAEEVLDGALLLVAGAMLVTPGIITDAIGFMLVIPATRAIIKIPIKRHISKNMAKTIGVTRVR